MAGRKGKGKNPIQGFSQRLAEARRGQYTQEKLAEIIGCTTQSIRKYESGERQPDDFNVIVNLANALNVSTDYLLGKDDEENWKVRDIANYIGISQKAAAKLSALHKDKRGRMLPLNGLILHGSFELLLMKLWELRNEAITIETIIENGELPPSKINSYSVCERAISGSELLKYDLDKVVKLFQEISANICSVDKVCEKWDHICEEQLLAEYEKHVPMENKNSK